MKDVQMTAGEAIFSRRSIRKFSDRSVSEDTVEVLLRAAMAAPNTVNNRDWAFVVVRDRDILAKLKENHIGNASMLDSAQLAVVVCGDLSLAYAKYPDFWIQDCSAAAENLIIMANALGIGTCWLGTYPVEKIYRADQATLGLPEELVPMAVIAAGYPAEDPDVRYRYEPGKVFYNRYTRE